MKTSRTFRVALYRAYTGETSLDFLIRDQEHVLRALAKYALRFKTAWYVNDEDDLFQEACIWLIRSMWEWDESRGTDLADYVVYNIGARLGTHVKKERIKRRHPDPNTSYRIDIWEHSHDDEGLIRESTIAGKNSNPETITAINEALENAEKNLTSLARDLLLALINNNGNLTWATRELLQRDHIRRRFGNDEDHLRYVLRQKIMPEIFHILQPTAIIP